MKSGRVLRLGTTRYQWPSSIAVVTVPMVMAESRKLAALPYGPHSGVGKASAVATTAPRPTAVASAPTTTCSTGGRR